MTVPEPVDQETALEAVTEKKLLRQPLVARLLITALLAEIGFAVLNISTMQVYLREDRKFGEGIIGLVLVAFLLSEAIFKSPMGQLADKFGVRRFLIIGPAMSVATSLLTLIVPYNIGSGEVLCFLALRVIDGIGAAMLWPAMFAAMGDATSDTQRQEAMSLLNLCYILGIALALPIGGAVNDLTGHRYASFFLAAILFAGVSLSALQMPKVGGHVADAGHPEEGSFKGLIESAKQIPAYLFLAIITFTGVGFPMAIIKLFATDVFHMSESAFGALVFPAAISMGVLSVPMAKFGEKLGRIKAVHFGMGLTSIGLWLIAAGAFVPWLRQSWIFALSGIPVGFGFLVAIPAWMASVSDINPAKRAANIGAVMTAQGLGAIIGAPVGGWLYEHLPAVGVKLHLGADAGRYSPFLGCAIFVTIGTLVGMRILSEKSSTKLPE